ncbi:hypothetical protein BU24DRAFT_425524 [Aaosphaeria arxii CBS 175.79]|uniref:UbiA prenyltransferase n=1 Tax=Aaosphaeria arxii CBS 175.79 TaxID=1450172 RepID=A0A6A5XIH2_9PLEO|nr:uncharacterized protein BU24DRAFT_425524 [Aaosphaeria arxii CBS 175.79]KAF2012922.1 hypothetical protein BU24DRAFT_425524 [Aaosphaeria arxii CBS 175.79]
MHKASTFRWMRTLLCNEAYSIWLFTRSDLKTIVLPQSIFGVLGAQSGSGLIVPPDRYKHDRLHRAPLVLLWVWIVLLPFAIDNQRRPEAIEEDKANKPWRPLPSKRLSPRHAFWLMLASHIAGVIYSLCAGGLRQKLIGIALGWIYNELGGADRSCIGKNVVNALGYVTFSTGAISVAVPGTFTIRGYEWFLLTGLMVLTTVQMQDLPDMEGDAARARNTVPLVIGSGPCRWSIAILVPFWTLLVIGFWWTFSLPAVLGAIIAAFVSWRVLNRRTVRDDKLTFRIWNLWIITIYAMPLANGSI